MYNNTTTTTTTFTSRSVASASKNTFIFTHKNRNKDIFQKLNLSFNYHFVCNIRTENHKKPKKWVSVCPAAFTHFKFCNGRAHKKYNGNKINLLNTIE